MHAAIVDSSNCTCEFLKDFQGVVYSGHHKTKKQKTSHLCILNVLELNIDCMQILEPKQEKTMKVHIEVLKYN